MKKQAQKKCKRLTLAQNSEGFISKGNEKMAKYQHPKFWA
jgi:hypothetical protein